MGCGSENIEIGKLDRRVGIETHTVAKHPDTNEEILTWVQYANVWAMVEPASRLRDDEKVILTRESAIVAYIVTVRYNVHLVNHKNRITIDGTVYDIEGHRMIGRKMWLQLYATHIE